MDIMHLDLNQVEALKGRGVVGVGKHVCGAATDLALRSLVRLLSSDNDMGTKVNEGVAGPSTQLCGVAMALCCHHRCCWSQLVGREFLSELGFTPQDFHLISHMTSWAVCGTRPPERGVWSLCFSNESECDESDYCQVVRRRRMGSEGTGEGGGAMFHMLTRGWG